MGEVIFGFLLICTVQNATSLRHPSPMPHKLIHHTSTLIPAAAFTVALTVFTLSGGTVSMEVYEAELIRNHEPWARAISASLSPVVVFAITMEVALSWAISVSWAEAVAPWWISSHIWSCSTGDSCVSWQGEGRCALKSVSKITHSNHNAGELTRGQGRRKG